MKSFNITSNFTLIVKPNWLDDFREKYDEPNEFHITLKQATFCEDNKISNLKKQLTALSKQSFPINVICNTLFFGKTNNGNAIMVRAKKNKQLIDLQKAIREQFSIFGDHAKPTHKAFEENFDPHITIGRHLSDEDFKKAKKELPESILCEAIVDQFILEISDVRGENDFSRIFKKNYPFKN